MRSITIDVPEVKISINGNEFTVLMADGEILERALALAEKWSADVDIENPFVQQEVRRDYETFVKDILGPDSLKIISKGNPIFTRLLQSIAIKITEEAASAYDEYMADNYPVLEEDALVGDGEDKQSDA